MYYIKDWYWRIILFKITLLINNRWSLMKALFLANRVTAFAIEILYTICKSPRRNPQVWFNLKLCRSIYCDDRYTCEYTDLNCSLIVSNLLSINKTCTNTMQAIGRTLKSYPEIGTSIYIYCYADLLDRNYSLVFHNKWLWATSTLFILSSLFMIFFQWCYSCAYTPSGNLISACLLLWSHYSLWVAQIHMVEYPEVEPRYG